MTALSRETAEPGASGLPWWPHREARKGAPSDPVTEERIVATALELLASEGAEGVSVRRIAAALDVSRATVYWWIGSRDRLLALVADAVHGQIELPPRRDRRRWTTQLRALARSTYDVYATYPGVLAVIDEGVLAGPNTLALLDRYLTILLDAGFDEQHAVWAWSTLTSVIQGALADNARLVEDQPWTAGQSLAGLPVDAYPGVVAVADQLQRSPYKDVDFAIDTVLRGLAR